MNDASIFKEVDNYRKDIIFQTTLKDVSLRFNTTWGLFSPREIDEGSRLLLDAIDVKQDDACLDIGCGYGPLGITLASIAKQGRCVMVDKDFVAVEYAKKNCRENHIANAEVFLSNGFNQITQGPFSLIVSNLPAKVGNEMLTMFIVDAWKNLSPGGRLVVVTISGLRKYIKRQFETVFGNYDKLKQGKNYTVAMAIK